ncbi:xanthosine utilization system XapX-like protein [Nocardioides marinisabuli]|uniref:Xanthosine utilization system XapX-like protein n=1 Tax=Nocardioides marinisabuli TaxID=419476 RepID=A0A7Y9F587_9ACTN|nr:hypothetical protein [Nocardioides marinisabuli]NYD59546.1 xanthosine utilization system XapX-like protein [Nocardioides marinisabuli]
MNAKWWLVCLAVACLIGVVVALVADPLPFSPGVSVMVVLAIIMGASGWTALQRGAARGARNSGISLRQRQK